MLYIVRPILVSENMLLTQHCQGRSQDCSAGGLEDLWSKVGGGGAKGANVTAVLSAYQISILYHVIARGVQASGNSLSIRH